MKKSDDLLPIRIDPKELKVSLGNGNFIFVGSGTDAWAFDISSDWITQFLDYCDRFNNRCLFKNKDPGRFLEFIGYLVMKKSNLCTTIETNLKWWSLSGCVLLYRSISVRIHGKKSNLMLNTGIKNILSD